MSVAALAGFGAAYLSARSSECYGEQGEAICSALPQRIGWPAFWAGVVGLCLLLIVLAVPGPFITVADVILARSELTQRAFESGRMLLSYQWRNALVFVLFLISAGAVIRISRCPIYLPRRLGGVCRVETARCRRPGA